jgi:hypothetical protein
MRKFTLAVLTTVLAMPALSAGASTRLVATPKCEEPVPTRQYDGQAITYGISIDLTGCWWWDGSPIQLEATLSRLDGTGEEGSTTVVLCGGRVLGEDRASGEDEAVDDDAKDRPDDTGPRGDARQDRADRDPDEGDDAGDDVGHREDGGTSKVASETDDTRRSTCEVATGLDHPPAELARYRGEVTYPWRDGPRAVSFTAYCASPGSVCRDG